MLKLLERKHNKVIAGGEKPVKPVEKCDLLLKHENGVMFLQDRCTGEIVKILR